MLKNKTRNREKIIVATIIFMILLLGLTIRLVYFMVVQSQYYSKKAEDLHVRERYIKAKRGKILDCNGVILADNITVCNISVIHNQIKERDKVVEVLSQQGSILEGAPKHRASAHKAWVNIMYGCDEFCTYCIVPYTRGKERSRAKEDIIKEVESLVAQGYIEVTLLGQNVNAYGKDRTDGYTFGDLLKDLDKTGIKRIRYTTSHPRDLDDKTIEAMATCKSVMPQLHLPVQSGDNEVLKRMNRKYTFEHYMTLIEKLKAQIPGISITTDIIVAFPGETEEQFQNTLKLVDAVQYEGAYTFIYSPREGTPAARMDGQIPADVAHDRLNRLIEKVNGYYLAGNERFVGTVQEVLVDGFSKNGNGMMCGYTPNLKLTHFNANDESLIGKLVKVKITKANLAISDG